MQRLSEEARVCRALVSIARSGNQHDEDIARAYAWDSASTKAAASDISTGDVNAANSTTAQFVQHQTRRSVLGRLFSGNQVIRAGFMEPINSPFSAVARWVPEGHSIPVSSGATENHRLQSMGVKSISVFTQEALQQEYAEEAVAKATEETFTWTTDEQFLDPSASDAEGPAPITGGDVESIPATSDPASDFKGLLQDFRNVGFSVLITHPETAARLNLSGNTAFQDVGVMGGAVAGLPVMTSQSVPINSAGSTVILLDPSRVICAMGGFEVRRTESGTLALDDEIDSNGDPENLVSLFQTDCVALRFTTYVNWKLLDSGAVRLLTGCDW